jgi:hypothetical protein
MSLDGNEEEVIQSLLQSIGRKRSIMNKLTHEIIVLSRDCDRMTETIKAIRSDVERERSDTAA